MGKPSQAIVKAEVARALEMFEENPALTFKEVGEALGKAKNTVRMWYSRNTHGFRDKYDELLKQRFAELESPAICALSDLIEQRHFQAVKYALDNRGYAAAQKIEADVKQDIVINIE